MWSNFKRMTVLAFLGFVIGVLVSSSAYAGNAIEPGEIIVDPPTVICLGLRWLIKGDENRNATVEVRYRKGNTEQWKKALPLFRTENETGLIALRRKTTATVGRNIPSIFAGSIFDLEPGTSYEIRLKMVDPDGGGAERTVKAKTRPVPRAINGRIKNCTPATLQAAVSSAYPGDVILVGPGVFRGTLNVRGKKGTPERPIVIRGTKGEKTILQGSDERQLTVIHANDSEYVHLENLVVKGPARSSSIQCNGAKGLVVRRCHIYSPSTSGHGMNNLSVNQPGRDFYVADNIFTGARKWPKKSAPGDPVAVGFNGVGHVICHNRFTDWNTAIQGADQVKLVYALNDFDIYNNDIYRCQASNIEVDQATHNVRVFRNRMTDCFIAVSTQPIYGGPCYIFRNVVYNSLHTPYKLYNIPTGVLCFHNTAIRMGPAFYCWSKAPVYNMVWRNNLTLGGKGEVTMGPTGVKAWENWNEFIRPDLDYDGFSAGKVIFNKTIYSNLQTFSRTNPLGLEKHGVTVDLSIFAKPVVFPKPNDRHEPPDLRLRPGCRAVDSGVVLPNINDGYSGRAPDLGAYELGQKIPHYGPRPEGIDEASAYEKPGTPGSVPKAPTDAVPTKESVVPPAKSTAELKAAGEQRYGELKQSVIKGVAAGKHERVYVDLAEMPIRAKIVAADEDVLTVTVGGSEFKIRWPELSAKRFYGIAKKYSADHQALMEYCISCGLTKEAEEEKALR